MLLIGMSITGCNETKSPVALQKEILGETEKLESSIRGLRDTVTQSHSSKSIAKQFRAARLQYKKVEWALEYFMPQILNPSEVINPEIAQDTYFRPRDFQNMDRIVASGKIVENKKVLLEEINSLLENSKSINAYLQTSNWKKTKRLRELNSQRKATFLEK